MKNKPKTRAISPVAGTAAPPIDCVVSIRLDSKTSGVAKFNEMLARTLSVPLLGVWDHALRIRQHPLFSFKVSELDAPTRRQMTSRMAAIQRGRHSSFFFHDFLASRLERAMIKKAHAVYAGNAEVREAVQGLHPRVIDLWSPPLLTETRTIPKTDITIFSFGMAHKIRREHFERLRELLEKTKKSYALITSAAFHESVSIEQSLGIFSRVEDLFGDRLFHMGFLSDVAVSDLIGRMTYFAAFFEKGVRANNSTVTAAMARGAAVITNMDRHSPPAYRHMENIIDIERCTALPMNPGSLRPLRRAAQKTAAAMSMEALAAALGSGRIDA